MEKINEIVGDAPCLMNMYFTDSLSKILSEAGVPCIVYYPGEKELLTQDQAAKKALMVPCRNVIGCSPIDKEFDAFMRKALK